LASLIDTYASQAGVIPGDPPNINVQVFPVPYDKYLTLHIGDGKIPAKHYDYWAEVINLIKPALNHFGIKVLQIGGPEDRPATGCDGYYLTLTRAQSAYVQKGSIGHIGVDSMPIHIASAFGKKIVAVYAHIYKEQSPANWSKPEDVIYLEPDRQGNHPCFGPVEYPKLINTIRPEIICRAIIQLFGLPVDINFTTQFVGTWYNEPVVEIIPDFFGENQELKGANLNIRLDKNFDEQCALVWAQHYQVKLISDRPINLELFFGARKNVVQLTLLIDNVDKYSLDYIKAAKRLFPNLTLVSTNDDQLSDVREKFFDWTIERLPEINRKQMEQFEAGSKFWTKKMIFSKAVRYPSLAHWKMKVPSQNTDFVLQDDEFARDLEHFYIYK
jgi:hypothetical protein